MKGLISVIVPVYNVEKLLDKCIKSIQAQTYSNIEIILVDDGSKDSCPQMCDLYANEDKRIQVIHKKNGGLSSARNAGIDEARGEFLLFVDSDDYIDKELCKTVVNCMTEKVDIVSFRFRRVYDDGQEEIKCTGKKITVSNPQLFKNYISRKDFTHMVCDKMFRTSLFNDLRFMEGRLAEDLAISYMLFGKTRKVVALDKCYYNYYFRTNSIMGTGSLKLCIDTYKGECEAFEYGNKNYNIFEFENNSRFLNQSMKTYLKLINRHGNEFDNDFLQFVKNNINKINKTNIRLTTKMFYYIFVLNKKIAWKLFNILHLS